ncbi:MAG: hypothetical protein ACN4G0_12775 [Polyangiales bacterium]
MRDKGEGVSSMMRSALLAVLVLAPGVAMADAIMVTRAMTATTIAEIFVEDDAVTVELEIGEDELGAFSRLVDTAEASPSLPAVIPPDAELSIVADGRALAGSIVETERRKRVDRDEVSGEPVPSDTEEGVLFLVLRYPLNRRPQTLVAGPPMKDNYVGADIGFVLYHRGIAINDFRYLSAKDPVLLDWDDPFYSRFARRSMNRKFNSPMNVFVYVEPFEVRKEFVVRPLDLARFTELDIEPNEPIEAERRAEFLSDVAGFLAERAPVVIDGKRSKPILDRIHFLKRGLRMTRVVTPDETIDGANAMIGAIFVYPVDGMPKDVRLDWDLFDERIVRVPASATDEAGPMPSALTPGDSQLHWVNYLKRSSQPGRLEVQSPQSHLTLSLAFTLGGVLAVFLLLVAWRRKSWAFGLLGIVLATAAWFAPSPSMSVPIPSSVRTPSGEEASPTIHALLYNIYRALDFRDEEVIFDRLAQSLTGEVLERVYLEMRKGLRLENQGGARVRVREVDLLEVTPVPSEAAGTLRYRSKWNATGSVGHWGHTHLRTNQYDARITLAATERTWRIAGIEILEEQRLSDGQP